MHKILSLKMQLKTSFCSAGRVTENIVTVLKKGCLRTVSNDHSAGTRQSSDKENIEWDDNVANH